MDSGRLETFSDGVFALAITLLVLNLRVLGPGHGSLLHQFGSQWPAYAALCVSFFVIGVIWVHHHNLFNRVAIVDRPLMALNLLLLLFVMVFPFPTATLATYLRHTGDEPHIAAAAYGLVVEGVALSFLAITRWTMRHTLLEDTVPPGGGRRRRAALRRRRRRDRNRHWTVIPQRSARPRCPHDDRDVLPRRTGTVLDTTPPG